MIAGIARALNEFGIVPDILTTRISFTQTDIEEMYGKNVRVNIVIVSRMLPFWGEWQILAFNARLGKIGSSYDLLINTSNSMGFLPTESNVLSYVFYPRKSRVDSALADIHFPERKVRTLSVHGFSKLMLRRVYRGVRLHPFHAIVTMTEFTKSALCQAYPDVKVDLPIVYPAVPFDDLWCEKTERENIVVTAGRFARDKRQLTQIEIARQLPNFEFHIFGFRGNSSYFDQCRKYIGSNRINNVQLHPDAPFSELVDCMQRAKYFLHTLVNEPFGLTAVQAMAAGCIPVVHNSGGQVEAVPVARLRYDETQVAASTFHQLEKLAKDDIDSMRVELQSHVRSHYHEQVFDSNIKHELMKALA